MNEKPQRQSDVSEGNVSRETSELTPEQVMLNEILDRAMAKYQDTPKENTEQESPTQEETPSPAEKESPPSLPEKNKPSSAYIYLAVLFGAAFLMLLLAYFVQQRNNAAVQEDLRITTASREELLDQIEQLEKENADLQKDVDLKQYAAERAREQYETARQERNEYEDKLHDAQSQQNHAIILWYLERFINEGDYLRAAAIVQQCDHYFNKNNWTPLVTDVLPNQITRYMELRNWLYDNGHIVMFTYSNDPDDSVELPVIAVPNAATSKEEQAICAAARNLWSIFWLYPNNPEPVAQFTAIYFHPDMGNAEQLNKKNFQPSTIAQLDEIKADLTDRGFLMEQDGLLYYAEDGKPVDFDSFFGSLESINGG